MAAVKKPLSKYALDTLAYCARYPTVPGFESNPGVWRRLCEDGLVENVPGGSHLRYRITDAGRVFVGASS